MCSSDFKKNAESFQRFRMFPEPFDCLLYPCADVCLRLPSKFLLDKTSVKDYVLHLSLYRSCMGGGIPESCVLLQQGVDLVDAHLSAVREMEQPVLWGCRDAVNYKLGEV